MARKARVDSSDALQHIIIRGIERKKIFQDDADRHNFLDRLGEIISESATSCYAWGLMPNHAPFNQKIALARGCNRGCVQKGIEIGRRPDLVGGGPIRSLLCYWAVRELGVSATALAKRLRLSQAGVSISVKRSSASASGDNRQN